MACGEEARGEDRGRGRGECRRRYDNEHEEPECCTARFAANGEAPAREGSRVPRGSQREGRGSLVRDGHFGSPLVARVRVSLDGSGRDLSTLPKRSDLIRPGIPAAPPPQFDHAPPGGEAMSPIGTPRRVGRLAAIVSSIAFVLVAVVLAGYFIHLPYYTLSPGGSLDVNARVDVSGATEYDTEGTVILLFVRQHARVNVWRYLRAVIDPDVDLFRQEELIGDLSPDDARVESRVDMALSQIAAKKLALEAADYDVPLAHDGVVVLGILPGRPADGVLEDGDVILSADETEIVESNDLGSVVGEHRPGETVELRVERDGTERVLSVGTTSDPDGRTIIGVFVVQQYDFPVDITIDTSEIGGPSAGLAMTLAVLDELTPGELTGGKRVAVTGTIDEDGTVGEIGGIEQKAVAARAAGAQLFLVPECASDDADARADCETSVEAARDRVGGDVPVVEVGTLADALAALVGAGGDPVP